MSFSATSIRAGAGVCVFDLSDEVIAAAHSGLQNDQRWFDITA